MRDVLSKYYRLEGWGSMKFTGGGRRKRKERLEVGARAVRVNYRPLGGPAAADCILYRSPVQIEAESFHLAQ